MILQVENRPDNNSNQDHQTKSEIKAIWHDSVLPAILGGGEITEQAEDNDYDHAE